MISCNIREIDMIGKPNATVRDGRGHVTRLRIYGTPNLPGKRRGGSGF